MHIKSYKDLDVWKKGIEIAELVYKLTRRFPKEEQYGLVSQMQRAAVSVPSNIAEGCARRHAREYQQACYVALGSCAELETELLIAMRLGYVADGEAGRIAEALDHEGRMLRILTKRLHNISRHEEG